MIKFLCQNCLSELPSLHTPCKCGSKRNLWFDTEKFICKSVGCKQIYCKCGNTEFIKGEDASKSSFGFEYLVCGNCKNIIPIYERNIFNFYDDIEIEKELCKIWNKTK